ncbi:hypothetical protein KKH05_02270 [Patescibacteria group bacterium]|nr:hypothetical protein [Patescibacteria group bacterium]
MPHRIALLVLAAFFGTFAWLASAILAGEVYEPNWLAWDLLAIFGLVGLWAFSGFFARWCDEDRRIAFVAFSGAFFVSVPAITESGDPGSAAIVVTLGAVMIAIAFLWALLAKPNLSPVTK